MPGVCLNSDGKESAEREGRYGTLIGYLIKNEKGSDPEHEQRINLG